MCPPGSENANDQLRLHRFHRNVVSSTSEHQAVHRLQHASPNGALKRLNSQAPRPARSTFKTTREPDDDARQTSACTSPRPPHGALLKLSAPPSLISKNGTWHQHMHPNFQRSRSIAMRKSTTRPNFGRLTPCVCVCVWGPFNLNKSESTSHVSPPRFLNRTQRKPLGPSAGAAHPWLSIAKWPPPISTSDHQNSSLASPPAPAPCALWWW